MKHLSFVIYLLSSILTMVSCEIDAYEKGEGKYSQMTAELVEAYVGSRRSVEYVETDDSKKLALQPNITADWIAKADTTYRAVLYYNKKENDIAEPVSINRVGVLQPHESSYFKEGVKTDPLYLESAWTSKNGRYLNLRLRLLTGSTADDEARHSIGMVLNAKTVSASHLQLYHDQGGRPEYYSTTVFASIPLSSVNTDTLILTVNTYDGPLTRTFVTPQGASTSAVAP